MSSRPSRRAAAQAKTQSGQVSAFSPRDDDNSDEEDEAYTANDAAEDFQGSDYETSSEEEEGDEDESDYESDEDDDDDEEEEGTEGSESEAVETGDEEESGKLAKKRGARAPVTKEKRRRKLNPFVELEATVGDEEEEEEAEELDELERQFIAPPSAASGEGEEEEEEEGITAADYQAQMRQRYLEREDIDVREEEARLRTLYGRIRQRHAPAGSQPSDERMLQQLLKPSASDARLWLVKCRIGKERAIVHQLLQQALFHAPSPNTSSASPVEGEPNHDRILSVLALDNVPGCVYVEAFRAATVAKAVDAAHLAHVCFCGPNGTRVQLVPTEEMTQVVTVRMARPLSTALIPALGSYVRLKGGKYAGDIAQVIEVPEDGTVGEEEVARALIRVRLVPRLPASGGPVAGRLPQRLFDPEEMNTLFPGKVHRSRGMWLFQGEQFRVGDGGFAHRDVRVSQVVADKGPTVQEQRWWGGAAGAGDGGAAVPRPDEPLQTVSVGDRVVVTGGEYVNVRGTVVSVVEHSEGDDGEGEERRTRRWIRLRPVLDDGGEQLFPEGILVEAAAVSPALESGDEVRLGSGPHAGASALVVQFSGPARPVVVFVPTANVQLEVPLSALSISREPAPSAAPPASAVPASSDGWGALRQMANLQRAAAHPQQEVPRKAVPRSGRPLLGKSVSIAYGPYKGYVGIVKDIVDEFNCRVELHTNSRLITVPTDKVIAAGSAARPHPASAAVGGWGERTPAWASARTPSLATSTSRTPAWSAARTPTTATTPSWQAGGARTPSWRTPSIAAGPVATAKPAKTPVWEPQPVGPKAKTPAWASTAFAASATTTTGASATAQPPPSQPSAPSQPPTSAASFAIEGVVVTHREHGEALFTISRIVGDGVVELRGLEAGAAPAGSMARVPVALLQAVRPQKRERAVVLPATSSGPVLKGQVIGLDEPDAVLKVDGTGEFKIIKLAALARIL